MKATALCNCADFWPLRYRDAFPANVVSESSAVSDWFESRPRRQGRNGKTVTLSRASWSVSFPTLTRVPSGRSRTGNIAAACVQSRITPLPAPVAAQFAFAHRSVLYGHLTCATAARGLSPFEPIAPTPRGSCRSIGSSDCSTPKPSWRQNHSRRSSSEMQSKIACDYKP
jgi:hypothetical protein